MHSNNFSQEMMPWIKQSNQMRHRKAFKKVLKFQKGSSPSQETLSRTFRMRQKTNRDQDNNSNTFIVLENLIFKMTLGCYIYLVWCAVSSCLMLHESSPCFMAGCQIFFSIVWRQQKAWSWQFWPLLSPLNNRVPNFIIINFVGMPESENV